MTNLDLTDAVEAAARAWFDRQQAGRMDAGRLNDDGTHIRWEQIGRLDQHAYRELVLPIVAAAVPFIVAQAQAGHQVTEPPRHLYAVPEDGNPTMPHDDDAERQALGAMLTGEQCEAAARRLSQGVLPFDGEEVRA